MVASIMPRTIGNIISPDSVGVAPFTSCNIRGRVIMPPNIPKPTITPTIVDIENELERNSASGSSASSLAARSAKMNAKIPKPPTTYMLIESVLPQPHSLPFSATKSSGTTASTIVTAPHQSMRCGFGVCGTCKNVTTMNNAMAPIGRLIKKTQRQPSVKRIESALANKPPTTGPRTEEVPNTARNIPW